MGDMDYTDFLGHIDHMDTGIVGSQGSQGGHNRTKHMWSTSVAHNTKQQCRRFVEPKVKGFSTESIAEAPVRDKNSIKYF